METNEFSEQTIVSEVNPPLGVGAWLALLVLVMGLAFFGGWKAHSVQAAQGAFEVVMAAGVPCVIVPSTGVDCDWQMATVERRD